MPESARPVRYGLAVGLIAFVVVAAFYALFDLLAGRGTFYTVDHLGRALIGGLGATTGFGGTPAIEFAVVAFYNVVHLVAALTIGVIVTALVEHAHRRPDRAPSILVVIIAGFVVTIGFMGAATMGVRAALPWWSIIAANALAVACAGWYLLQRYPAAFRRFTNPARGGDGSSP